MFIAFVLSTKARAKILKVDPSAALQMPGVKDYICAKDVPGKNIFGVWPSEEEEIFASCEVLTLLLQKIKMLKVLTE